MGIEGVYLNGVETIFPLAGDLGHAGAGYAHKNIRAHVYIDSPLYPRDRDEKGHTVTFKSADLDLPNLHTNKDQYRDPKAPMYASPTLPPN